MLKEAFFKAFFEKRKKNRLKAAHEAYHSALNDTKGISEHHPLPKKVIDKWVNDFNESKIEKAINGYNYHADQFNGFLVTPEGRKWNTEQGKKYLKLNKG